MKNAVFVYELSGCGFKSHCSHLYAFHVCNGRTHESALFKNGKKCLLCLVHFGAFLHPFLNKIAPFPSCPRISRDETMCI